MNNVIKVEVDEVIENKTDSAIKDEGITINGRRRGQSNSYYKKLIEVEKAVLKKEVEGDDLRKEIVLIILYENQKIIDIENFGLVH